VAEYGSRVGFWRLMRVFAERSIKIIDHVERHDRVWIRRRIDIARHWISTHPPWASA